MNWDIFFKIGAGLLALWLAFWAGATHENGDTTDANVLGWISVIIILGLLVTS